ncbi:MAG: ATP-binding protein [Devosia sp.]
MAGHNDGEQSRGNADAALASGRAPILIWMASLPDGGIWFSEPWLAFTGQPLAHELADGWARNVYPDDRDRVFRERAEAFAARRAFRTEYRLKRHDGVWRSVEDSAVPRFDGEGGFKGFVGSCIDVTDQRLAQNALRESEARLRFLDALGKETARSIDAAQILSITTRMVAQHLNLAICAYADMEPDQDHFTIRGDWSAEGSPSIVGYYSLADFGKLAVKNLGAGLPLVINNNLTELAPEEAATFQSIGITATICMPLVKDGRLTALMAIHDRKPRDWTSYELGLTKEVTERSWAHIERVRSEASVREGERQLVQAQKMEAIGNLTGGMAHDFNNLLGVIIGNIDLLSESVGDDTDTQLLASEALAAAQRGADLTRRLLAFARRQPLQPQLVQPNELVGGIVKLLGRTLGEAVEISLELAPDIAMTMVDPAQLEASIVNLANNARDAMPKGGRLKISTANRQLDAEYVASHVEVIPGDYAMIEVSDTGVGMPQAVLERVFEPFFTTKELGKGTGLGLSMVFGFVRQSGGHVHVYSEEGIGTTFRLYLPRAQGDARAASAIAAPAASAGGGETVLVVEDNESLRRIVLRQLTSLGYQCLEANGAGAALAILEAVPVDLLFTDVVMPGGMNGYELGRLTRTRWPMTKVLLTSGFPEEKLNGNAAAPWNMRLLNKPYRKEELARVVRDSLEE